MTRKPIKINRAALPASSKKHLATSKTPALAYGRDNRTQLAWQDDRNGGWDLYTAVLDRRYQVTHPHPIHL